MLQNSAMRTKRWLTEGDLAAIAKCVRKKAGKSRAQAARDLGVSQTSIFHAEESPRESLLKLRTRMIETYSDYQVCHRIELVKRTKPI